MTHQELEALAGPDIVQPRSGLYLVTRTSNYRAKPCDEARPIRVVNSDDRNRDDPIDEETRAVWAAEIPDLLAFVDVHGQCVVNTDSDGWSTIEIYDDYRE